MDDLPLDYTPVKTRNNKRIILIVAVVALVAFAVFSSYQTKYVDDSAKNQHAILTKDISISGGRISAQIMNDGNHTWDVSSLDVVGGKSSCNRLPKGVKSNETVSVSCLASGIEKGASYSVLIYLNDVNDESKRFLISGVANYQN